MPRVWSAMLMPEDHAGARVMMSSGLTLLPKVMCGSKILPQLGSMMMPLACVSTGSHWNHAVLSQSHSHWPWDS